MESRLIVRSRSDLFILCCFTLLFGAIGAAAFAQDNSANPTPSTLVVRTATQLALSDDLPDQAEPPEKSVGATQGFFSEPRIIRRMINFATRTAGDGTTKNSGFYPEFSNMPTGSGWISAGPGYRQYLLSDRLLLDGSAAVSWRMYKMAQARVELPKLARSRLAAGSQFIWHDLTQVNYFGTGAGSIDEDRSEYRMKYADTVGYAKLRPVQWLTIGGSAGWLHRPKLLSPAGTFKRGNPATPEIFANDVVYGLSEQPNFAHGEASITADTRDSRSHPTSGGVYRAVVASYSDRNAGMFSFRRFEAEAAHFVPVADRRVVFAMRGWLVGTGTDAGQMVPFYMMPSLGGGNTLRAFTDFRFHDRNMVILNAESRVALFAHVDVAAFVDAGNVAARVSDLNLDKRAYGIGLRMHTGRATFARFDLAHGPEGWRFLIKTNDPLHLSRLSRQTAAVPFVP